VRAGERTASVVDQAAILLIYAVIAWLVFVPRYFTPILLIVFFAFKYAVRALRLLASPRPATAPAGYPGWPTWFSAVTFFHNRQFGGLLILGLIIDAVLHVIPYTAALILRFWPPT
jgi:1,4-dihydroxy-2-naphthoate octaprenyltransferase